MHMASSPPPPFPSTTQPHTGPAPAFQVCNNPTACGTNCQRLGDKAVNGNFSTRFNPAHGVTLYYTNGDNCSTPSGLRPRCVTGG
jgi:hypothetical protein